MSDAPTPPDKVGLTSLRQVSVAFLAGILIAVVLLQTLDLLRVFAPVVPWSVPVVLALMAVAALIWSRVLPGRIEGRRVTGQEGMATVVVAKSAVMTGLVLAGMHVVYVLRFIGQMSAPAPAQRVWVGLATIVTALLVAGAGHLLERACVVDTGDDDPDQDEAEPSGR